MTVKFITLGCKTNIYESEAIARLFKEAGHEVVSSGSADACVINTCTVTGTGAAKSLKQIRRARRENPNAVLAVMGCLAQTEPERLRQAERIDVLIGTQRRGEVVKLCEAAAVGRSSDIVSDISGSWEYEELGIARGQHRIRAEIKIEDGCNNFCSYCKIPYARGRVRSRSMEKIAEEARALLDDGYSEIVLTGIHIGSYGGDLNNGTGLVDVMETVERETGISRLRLGSVEPGVITEDFIKRAALLKSLCPQFHLSLQSGCDKTLAAMRRRYTAEEFAASVGRLRRAFPDAAITTDLIVGFPGETAEDFETSRAFCEQMRFARMHIFPYSVREGTAAATFPDQVGEEEKTRRAHIMLEAAERMKNEFCKGFAGRELPVLFEQKKDGMWSGFTENYIEVRVNGDDLKRRILKVKITGYNMDGGYLTGTV